MRYFSDKYDVKLNWAPTQSSNIQVKYHKDDWPWSVLRRVRQRPRRAARRVTRIRLGASGFDQVLSPTTFLEVAYAGYDGLDIHESRTGSLEDPFIDYSPPGGGPETFSGGLYFPWAWDTKPRRRRRDRLDLRRRLSRGRSRVQVRRDLRLGRGHIDHLRRCQRPLLLPLRVHLRVLRLLRLRLRVLLPGDGRRLHLRR